jgi:hypothetical protein
MGTRRRLAIWALAVVAGANGCASMNHTERGAVTGGAVGSALGAMIGSDRGHTGRGAAIGGLAGAAVGAAVGSAADADERRVQAAVAAEAAPVRGPLSLEEIADMAQRGISEEVIRNQIRTSRTRYNLSPAQITWLHENRVSDGVISEMQQTALYGRPAAVYVDRGPEPVYVIPAPRPRPRVYGPSVGVSVGWWR